MTEKSYLWQQETPPIGDDVYSPYNASEFNDWMFSNLIGDSLDLVYATTDNLDDAFVVPDYLNTLFMDATGDGAHSVTINSGAAIVHGHLYILDEGVSKPIDLASAGMFRIDSIILRAKNNKVRLEIIKGAEVASDPVKPVLTQSTGTWEVELATVYVDGDFSVLENKNIEDQRKFLYNNRSRTAQPNTLYNLLVGSEWMSFSGAFGATFEAPDMWLITGTPSTYIYSGYSTGSGRGFCPQLAGSGTLYQWIAAGSQKTFTVSYAFYQRKTTVTGSGYMLVGLRAYRTDGSESTLYKEVEYPPSLGDTAVFREGSFTVTFPEEDILFLKFYVTFTNVTEAEILQCEVYPGYHTGYYHQIDEPVMFTRGCTDASWAATAKSTGATTINLGASFVSTVRSVQNHAKAVILRLRGRDSGSAGGACSMNVQGYAAPFNEIYGTLTLQGITNDTWEEIYVIVPVNQIYWGTGVAGAQFRVNIVATGVGTFDATIEIVGIIT